MTKTPISKLNTSISNIFRAVRIFRNLQQTEFAIILEVTQGTISKIENASMKTDLAVWFKFLRKFQIRDAYSFEIGGVYLEEEEFKRLDKNKSKLMPNYEFKPDAYIYRVAQLKPLYEILISNDMKSFKSFLNDLKVKEELFYILNHPLPLDFVDEFFEYLNSRKINEKSLQHLNIDFCTTLGNLENQTIDEALSKLGYLGDSGYKYGDFKKASYNVGIAPDSYKRLTKIKNFDFVTSYSILFPYYFLKSNFMTKNNPKIKNIEEELHMVNF